MAQDNNTGGPDGPTPPNERQRLRAEEQATIARQASQLDALTRTGPVHFQEVPPGLFAQEQERTRQYFAEMTQRDAAQPEAVAVQPSAAPGFSLVETIPAFPAPPANPAPAAAEAPLDIAAILGTQAQNENNADDIKPASDKPKEAPAAATDAPVPATGLDETGNADAPPKKPAQTLPEDDDKDDAPALAPVGMIANQEADKPAQQPAAQTGPEGPDWLRHWHSTASLQHPIQYDAGFNRAYITTKSGGSVVATPGSIKFHGPALDDPSAIEGGILHAAEHGWRVVAIDRNSPEEFKMMMYAAARAHGIKSTGFLLTTRNKKQVDAYTKLFRERRNAMERADAAAEAAAAAAPLAGGIAKGDDMAAAPQPPTTPSAPVAPTPSADAPAAPKAPLITPAPVETMPAAASAALVTPPPADKKDIAVPVETEEEKRSAAARADLAARLKAQEAAKQGAAAPKPASDLTETTQVTEVAKGATDDTAIVTQANAVVLRALKNAAPQAKAKSEPTPNFESQINEWIVADASTDKNGAAPLALGTAKADSEARLSPVQKTIHAAQHEDLAQTELLVGRHIVTKELPAGSPPPVPTARAASTGVSEELLATTRKLQENMRARDAQAAPLEPVAKSLPSSSLPPVPAARAASTGVSEELLATTRKLQENKRAREAAPRETIALTGAAIDPKIAASAFAPVSDAEIVAEARPPALPPQRHWGRNMAPPVPPIGKQVVIDALLTLSQSSAMPDMFMQEGIKRSRAPNHYTILDAYPAGNALPVEPVVAQASGKGKAGDAEASLGAGGRKGGPRRVVQPPPLKLG